MSITKKSTANHDEWLALRAQYIGGSDAGAVVGLKPYASPYSLWAEKTGRVQSFGGNLATEVGTYLEEFVAQKFAAETGKRVRKCNLSWFNSKYPWAIGNIDREIIGEDAGLEIKTTSELNLKKFNGVEFPEQYYCQCVHYLAVTGKQRWYLAVLIGNREFMTFTLDRDEAEISALMDAERDFWQLVQTDTPPAVDGTAATTNALSAVYADSNDDSIDLYPHAEDINWYVSLGQQIKELEKLRDEAANRIKAYMGSAGGGELGDKYRVTWKTQTRRTFDSKRFIADYGNRASLDDYFKESTTRVFRVTEKGA